MSGNLKPEAAKRYRLTQRQTVVLGLVCQGLMNKQIAHRLGVSIKNVESHVTQANRCLGVCGQRAAIAKLYRERLVELPDV